MRRKMDIQAIAEAAERQRTVAPTEGDYRSSLEHKAVEEEKLNIISFFLDGREFAFEVADAVEVLRPRQVTEVPRTQEYIRGILSVRGEMVPIFDLKKRLGTGSADNSPTARILIVSADDLKAGFLVDRLSGVKEVRAASLQVSVPEAPVSETFLKGVFIDGDRGDRRIMLLNLLAVLGVQEQ